MKRLLVIAVGLSTAIFFETQCRQQFKKGESMITELRQDFEKIRDQAFQIFYSETNGRIWWNEQKPWIIEKYGDEPLFGLEWKRPLVTEGFDPDDLSQDFMNSDDATPLHFLNQLKRIPLQQVQNARRILQIALNVGQGMAAGSVEKKYTFDDFICCFRD